MIDPQRARLWGCLVLAALALVVWAVVVVAVRGYLVSGSGL